MAPRKATEEELERRKIIGVNAETVTDVSSTDFPGHWPGEDNSWDLEAFRKQLKIIWYQNAPYEASFSLIGVDASIANAFRRILLAEIPTLAIEYVFVHNNTSIIQDEVLAQRLGLIPLKGSVAGIRSMDFFQRAPEGQPATGATNRNAVVLKLAVECTRNQDAKKGEDDPTKLFNGAHVYAKDIEWVKQAGQDKMFPEPDGGIGVTNPDILLAKMRPGQVIDLDMWAILGYGADHAKFSPVATASYRLLPSIEIVKPILGDDAKKFARCFPRGVIGLEDVTKEEAAKNGSGYEGHQGDKKAVVRDVFSDTVSRECLRHEEFHGKVKLGRKRDHFIFSIESTGQFESDDLFLESIMVLKQKCQHFKRALDEMIR